MEQQQVSKRYVDTFLYGKGYYEKDLFTMIMSATRIDKNNESFSDILSFVKRRQTTNLIIKVLENESIVLMHYVKPLPKAFKVFSAKDIKTDKGQRVFIDVSDIFRLVGGRWVCDGLDIFIARLVSAIPAYIYFSEPFRIENSSKIVNNGVFAFAKLFTNIIDYLYKISTIESQRAACLFLSAKYFLVNIIGKDPKNESVIDLAKKVAEIGDGALRSIAQYEKEDSYKNIDTFIKLVADTLKLNKLQLDNFLEKWLYLYGTGTQFSLEFFPAFSNILTDAYSNSYIINQKTIEKVTEQYMVDFTKAIFELGNFYFK